MCQKQLKRNSNNFSSKGCISYNLIGRVKTCLVAHLDVSTNVIITDTNKPINIYKCSEKKIESIDCLHKHDNTHFTVHNSRRKRIFFTRATFIFIYHHRVYKYRKYRVSHKFPTLGISREIFRMRVISIF